MTEQPTSTIVPLRYGVWAIMICTKCLKPMRFEAVSTGAHHIRRPEPVPCPYGPHTAAKRESVGWWQSFELSPEQQASWVAQGASNNASPPAKSSAIAPKDVSEAWTKFGRRWRQRSAAFQIILAKATSTRSAGCAGYA